MAIQNRVIINLLGSIMVNYLAVTSVLYLILTIYSIAKLNVEAAKSLMICKKDLNNQ